MLLLFSIAARVPALPQADDGPVLQAGQPWQSQGNFFLLFFTRES